MASMEKRQTSLESPPYLYSQSYLKSERLRLQNLKSIYMLLAFVSTTTLALLFRKPIYKKYPNPTDRLIGYTIGMYGIYFMFKGRIYSTVRSEFDQGAMATRSYCRKHSNLYLATNACVLENRCSKYERVKYRTAVLNALVSDLDEKSAVHSDVPVLAILQAPAHYRVCLYNDLIYTERVPETICQSTCFKAREESQGKFRVEAPSHALLYDLETKIPQYPELETWPRYGNSITTSQYPVERKKGFLAHLKYDMRQIDYVMIGSLCFRKFCVTNEEINLTRFLLREKHIRSLLAEYEQDPLGSVMDKDDMVPRHSEEYLARIQRCLVDQEEEERFLKAANKRRLLKQVPTHTAMYSMYEYQPRPKLRPARQQCRAEETDNSTGSYALWRSESLLDTFPGIETCANASLKNSLKLSPPAPSNSWQIGHLDLRETSWQTEQFDSEYEYSILKTQLKKTS